jgi:hypothetical protein
MRPGSKPRLAHINCNIFPSGLLLYPPDVIGTFTPEQFLVAFLPTNSMSLVPSSVDYKVNSSPTALSLAAWTCMVMKLLPCRPCLATIDVNFTMKSSGSWVILLVLLAFPPLASHRTCLSPASRLSIMRFGKLLVVSILLSGVPPLQSTISGGIGRDDAPRRHPRHQGCRQLQNRLRSKVERFRAEVP